MKAKPHITNAFPEVNFLNKIHDVSIKKIEDLQDLNALPSLQNQVQALRLKDRLGKENFHKYMRKVFEPVTKSIKNVSEVVTKTITETSNNNNKPLEKLNNNLLEILNDRGILASYLMSLLAKIANSIQNTKRP